MVKRRAPLPPREQQVLALIGHGSSTSEIARELGVGYDTASQYVSTVIGYVKRRGHSERGEPPTLTARQQAVLELLVHGQTDKEIAAALGIGIRTAESHVQRVLNHFGVHDRRLLNRPTALTPVPMAAEPLPAESSGATGRRPAGR